MKTLSYYTLQSLRAHRKVSVKGLGHFTSEFVPAVWNEATKMFVPPTKKARFSFDPKVGAHSLAIAIAQADRCTLEQANKKLDIEVALLHETMQTSGRLKCDLGIFYLEDNQEIAFKPSIDQNLSSQFYGLNIFRVPIKENGKTAAPISIERPSMPVVKSKARTWLRAAAMLVPAAGLLYIGAQKADVGLPQINTAQFFERWFNADVNEEDAAAKQTEELVSPDDAGLPEIDQTEIVEENEGHAVVQNVEKPTPQPKKADTPKPEKAARTTQVQSAGYHIIVGSFKDAENAQSLAAVLETQGFAPVILDDKTAYTKVSLGRHDNRLQAEAKLKDYKARVNSGAWIYKGN